MTRAWEFSAGTVTVLFSEQAGLMGVFPRPSEAVVAAALEDERAAVVPRSAMALHACELRSGDERASVDAACRYCEHLCASASTGQILLSRPVRDLVAAALPEGMSLVPLPGSQDVWVLAHPDVSDGGASQALRPTPPTNLPDPVTSFVGREQELGEAGDVLGDTRLLTLTGAGGCGKSRLGLRLAGRLVDRFPEGIWWVDLSALADEDLVGAAIGDPLGVRPLPGVTDLQAVCAELAGRTALVLLDNCEHVLAGVSEAGTAILAAAPGVKIYQPVAAGCRRGVGLAPALARAAARFVRGRCRRGIGRRPAVRRAGAQRAAELRGDRRQRAGRRADLPRAGRDPAGDRARRRTRPDAVGRAGRSPAV